jgi:hypothetical protein
MIDAQRAGSVMRVEHGPAATGTTGSAKGRRCRIGMRPTSRPTRTRGSETGRSRASSVPEDRRQPLRHCCRTHGRDGGKLLAIPSRTACRQEAGPAPVRQGCRGTRHLFAAAASNDPLIQSRQTTRCTLYSFGYIECGTACASRKEEPCHDSAIWASEPISD